MIRGLLQRVYRRFAAAISGASHKAYDNQAYQSEYQQRLFNELRETQILGFLPQSPIQTFVPIGKYNRFDVAFPECRLGIYIDSVRNTYEPLITLQHQILDELFEGDGWRILRFTTEEIQHDLESVIEIIAHTLSGQF